MRHCCITWPALRRAALTKPRLSPAGLISARKPGFPIGSSMISPAGWPLPCARMRRIRPAIQMNTPRTLTAMTRSKAASVCSSRRAILPSVPALSTPTSMRVWRRASSSKTPAAASSSATSAAKTLTPGPSVWACACSNGASRSTSTSWAPSAWKRRAVSRPMPPVDPVIKTVLPAKRCMAVRPTQCGPRRGLRSGPSLPHWLGLWACA